MLVSEDKVREELKKVIDPELFVNIVDLGLIYNIEITDAAADAAKSEAEQSAQTETTAQPQPTPPTAAADSAATNTATGAASSPASNSTPAAEAGSTSAEAPYDGPMANITIEMTMTSPACPAGPQLIGGSKNVVSRMKEVQDVEVKLVMDPPWTPDRMTEDARDQLGIF